jgi:hypothetical protein
MGTEENELLGELLNGELAAEDVLNPATNEDVAGLKDQIESLEKERKGLLDATKAERKKRQDSTARLNHLEGAVSGILSQRQQQGIESLSENESAAATSKGLPVVYDDDGNAWVDPTAVTNLVSPYEQEINNLKDQLQLNTEKASAVDTAEKVRQSIIGEDERYGTAAGKYRAARKWVEDAVVNFARNNNVNRPITSGEALDYVLDTETRNEFTESFGNLDIVDIVTAEDSQDHFRRMLDSVATAMNPAGDLNLEPKDKMDSRFQQVMKKPSALGNQANAKAGQANLLEKVGNMSTQDIMDLSDAQMEALMTLSSREI